MNKKEKDILKAIVNHHEGLIYPAILPVIAKENKREFQKLISKSYIEEVSQEIPSGKNITFYRATEKGHMFFDHFYKKIWDFLKGDIRTIIIAIITSVIITVVTLYLEKI